MNPDTRPDAGQAIEQFAALAERVRGHIGRAVVGQRRAVDLLLISLLCRGHCLLIGVPGLAKTLMVKSLAGALGWKFGRISFTPDLMPSDIVGTDILQTDATTQRREMVFSPGPVFAQLLLADEINRTPPKTQAALLEAMQEHAVTVGGRTYPLGEPFVVVATQNPIEQEGTYPLPEAQLDRFLLSVHLDYPDATDETAIAGRLPGAHLNEGEALIEGRDFSRFAELVDAMPVSRQVIDHAVALARATRPSDDHADGFVREHVAWGVGPRGTQQLVHAARAAALLEGLPSPELRHVRDMALPVFRHRLLASFHAQGQGIDPPRIVEHVLRTVRPAGLTKD